MTEKKLSIQQNMLWNSIGSVVYLACQWLITVLVVRLSDDLEAAGILALGMAVSNVFTPVGQYKVRPFQVSDVRGQFSTSQYIAFRIITIAVSLVVMLVYGYATCEFDTLPAVFAYGVYSLGPTFVDVLHGADQQKYRMDIIGKSCIIRGILSVAIFAASMVVTRSLLLSLFAMTISTYAVIVLFDMRQTAAICGGIFPDFNIQAMKTLFIECAPAVVGAFICSAIPSIPRQVLGALDGASALGIYASVASPVLIIQMGAQYIYGPLLSEFAIRFERREASAYRRLLYKTLLAIAMVTIVGVIGFALFGEWALGFLYGAEVARCAYLLIPLCICSTLTACSWLLSDLLIAARDLLGNLIGYLISFVVCLVVMYPAIVQLGMNGVTVTTILAYCIGVVFSVYRLLKRIRCLDRS